MQDTVVLEISWCSWGCASMTAAVDSFRCDFTGWPWGICCSNVMFQWNKTMCHWFVPTFQVGGLASENVRWAEAVENFKKQERTLCGDVLLITAFISYLGYFTKRYRLQLMDNTWRPYLSQLKVGDLKWPSHFTRWHLLRNVGDYNNTIETSRTHICQLWLPLQVLSLLMQIGIIEHEEFKLNFGFVLYFQLSSMQLIMNRSDWATQMDRW